MQVIKGTSNRYLDVNLSLRTWRVLEVNPSDLALFLGGKGLALKLYYDRFGEDRLGDVDSLGPENPVVFSMGVMLSTGAPCSARFEVVTRSPQTGLMVGSSCGGPFGEACKTAGWDGVIISGKADAPTVLRIDREGASFEDGALLWGMDTHETQEALNLGPKESAAVIGPAGENLVKYANLRSGHRFAGRGGIGAVMGSKNLKAVVARGKDVRYEPVLPKAFVRTVRKSRKYILRNTFTRNYRAYGTNANVMIGKETGFAPVRNFRDRWHPELDAVSGETMAERYTTRHSACRHCTVLCGHKGHYPDGKMRQIPEYETTGMFGSNIGNFDPDIIGEWNELMNNLGMDTISAGGTLAWAMEAGEKGLRETDLTFGRTDNIAAVLEDIALRRGKEGDDLAEGSRTLAKKYGGEDFAIHVKGLEIAAYDPRSAWGHGLGYAVYNKGGCHLGSYMVGLEQMMKYIDPHTTMGKAEWVVFMEDIYTGINSLQTCLFTGFGIITEPPIPRFLPPFMLRMVTPILPKVAQALMDWSLLSGYFTGITGIRMNKWGFLKAGERINKLERRMNVLMGSRPEDDTLPDRFLKEKDTPYPGKNTVVPIEPMVRRYRKLRRYGADGGPGPDDLARLMGPGRSRLPHSGASGSGVRPARQPLKRIYVAVVMAVLGWFVPNIACRKESVREEVRCFHDGFRLRLTVWPAGPSVAFERRGNRLRRIPAGGGAFDLTVHLKSMDAAWLLFSFQEGTCASEAAGRLAADGNLPDVCTFIRLMNKTEILLLPKPIARLAVKEWEPVR